MRCFGDPKDTIDSKQLKNQIYLLRFGHTRALLFKKKGHEMAISPVLGKLTHICIYSREANVQFIQRLGKDPWCNKSNYSPPPPKQ